MLDKYTIEALSETLPLRQMVRPFKKQGATRWDLRNGGPTPADQMKRPWVVEVNGVPLGDGRQRVFRYASEKAAAEAGQKYVKAITEATIGYYWEIVHVATSQVVNSGFTAGFGKDVPGVREHKPGLEMRTIAAYRTPFLEI